MTTPIVVLLVEGDPELRDMLIEALGWEGFEVVAARDEAEATKVLRDRAVDLLVSDPPSFENVQRAMDVLAAVEREFPDLPVIAVAEAVPEPVYFHPWTTVGRKRTLRRPFRLSDLIGACREAVAGTIEVLEQEEEEEG